MSRRKRARKIEDEFLNKVEMSVPWGAERSNNGPIAARFARGVTCLQEGKNLSQKELGDFVKERSAVHVEYIRQTQSTKRWAMAIGCSSIIASCAMLVFAREGREITAYVVGVILIIVAAGSFGYARVRIKNSEREISVDSE